MTTSAMRSESGAGPKKASAAQVAQTQAALAKINPKTIGDPGALVSGAKIPGGVQLPYPNAPHDGSPQDQANTAAITGQIQKFNNQQYAITNQPTLIDKLALGLNLGLATAGLGSVVGPAAAGLVGGTGTTAGAIAGGAATGMTGGALKSALSGGNVLQNIGIGGALGAVGGGLNAASSPVTTALKNAGINPTVAAGLVKGAIGAGTGALGGAINGGGVGRGALVGGLAGATSGALGQATGNTGLGQIGGTIAGGLAGKYLAPSPASPKLPAPTVPAASQSASIPTMPGTPQATGTQNIGSYSGYGYAPRTQIANPVSDYSTYGQGPEAQFFKTTGAASPPPVTATAAPTAPNFANAPVMSNIQNTGINKQNSV